MSWLIDMIVRSSNPGNGLLGTSVRVPWRLGAVGVPLTGVVMLFLICACDPSPEPAAPRSENRWAWSEARDAIGVKQISRAPSFCSDCLAIERLVQLDADSGPGMLAAPRVYDVAVDSRGRSWVSETTTLKVYGPSGEFLTQIGREGEGPGEFQHASWLHIDAEDVVHVVDRTTRRETLVDPSFQVVGERRLRLPTPNLVRLRDGRYFAGGAVMTVDAIGLPLHIVDGQDVVRSFGTPLEETDVAVLAFHLRRHVTSTATGVLISVKHYDYSIEAWTDEGVRIAGFQGETLNDPPVTPGPSTFDKFPDYRITGMHVDESARLWIRMLETLPSWRDAFVERMSPDGSLTIRPRDDAERKDAFHTRIDVIDLATAELLASQSFSRTLWKFLGNGLIVEEVPTAEGESQFMIARFAAPFMTEGDS